MVRDVSGPPAYNVGDLIMTPHNTYEPVTEIHRYGPGEHPHSPLVKHQGAVEYKTARGSRWFGDAYRGEERADRSSRVAALLNVENRVNEVFNDRRS
jgi:hypothetical protein